MPVVNLIRFVEISHFGTGSMKLKTNILGPAQAEFCTVPLATAATRLTRRYTIPGNGMAIESQLKFIPTDQQDLAVFTARIYAKALGVGPSPWRWVPVEIPGVTEEWAQVKLAIPQTPEEWTRVPLQIPPTPEEWTPVPIVNGKTTPWTWIDTPGGEG